MTFFPSIVMKLNDQIDFIYVTSNGNIICGKRRLPLDGKENRNKA